MSVLCDCGVTLASDSGWKVHLKTPKHAKRMAERKPSATDDTDDTDVEVMTKLFGAGLGLGQDDSEPYKGWRGTGEFKPPGHPYAYNTGIINICLKLNL